MAVREDDLDTSTDEAAGNATTMYQQRAMNPTKYGKKGD